MDDAIIIGGSFAGLTAALQIARARRAVTVLDHGLPRNRFASHSHGVMGSDGASPWVMRDKGKADLAAYPTAKLVDAEAVDARVIDGGFAVIDANDVERRAQRLILAYGVTDIMPELPGFAESWGKSVLHCPYCHGYEVGDRRLGLLYSSALSLHATALIRDWSDDLTLFSNGADIAEAEKSKLAQRGVKLVEQTVAAIAHQDGQLDGIVLADGSRVALDALFAHPRNAPASDLHSKLGIRTVDGPLGPYIEVDDKQETSLKGVFAAGDAANPRASINVAFGTGVLAGAMCHQSMLV